MKRLNKAFTLTELLVALGVIGILCAILLPIIFNLLPNQNVIMAKRAYYMVQSVVADLINDEACYPDKTSGTTGNARVGFDDGYGYANCNLWGGNEETGTITSEGNSNKKFTKLYTDKIDIAQGPDGIGSNKVTFTTKDGMDWAFVNTGFTANSANSSVTLVVDVNGSDEPDCGQSAISNTAITRNSSKSCANRTSWDRFSMTIHANGKIEVNDNWASQAIKVNRDITSDKENNDD